jgi:hypothetical protein
VRTVSYRIARLALFGSVLRDDFDPARSAIDVLVEFLPDAHIGWEFVDMQQQLTSIFQREVDLHTPRSIHHRFRDHAVATAQVIYERSKAVVPVEIVAVSAAAGSSHAAKQKACKPADAL